MVRLKIWQWLVLGAPIAAIALFLLTAAGLQIHTWGLSWIWAVVGVVFVGWRWLLVRWTRPALDQFSALLTEVTEELEDQSASTAPAGELNQQAEAALQAILTAARNDAPVWEDGVAFWQRCQQLLEAIAHVYYPTVKRPLLNIYVPQGYALLRGTVDDMDQWMQKLGPALNQVTIGQAVEAYELYRKLEPSARKVLQVWSAAQWLLNPVVAVTRRATRKYSTQANQQLLGNLSQLLRDVVLQNLGRQAIALYSGTVPKAAEFVATPTLPAAKVQTLREIITQATPAVEQKPLNILLVGRTGAGKSSLINTLFIDQQGNGMPSNSPVAAVDVLPSTDRIQDYHWQAATGETLTLWDTPGYEQTNRADLRQRVLDYLPQADLLLLATPALDPALQMDVDFLQAAQATIAEVPTIILVTQVDRLRPLREWTPPYDWETGDRPKEIAIREAVQYRVQQLVQPWNSSPNRATTLPVVLPIVLPIVSGGPGRTAWGLDALSLALMDVISPAKQARLARFLRDVDARTAATAKIIDRYVFQMATTQGLAALLKSPVLGFLSTLATGSPTLAYVLAEKIPVEQLPLVVGKLQMAYDLFGVLKAETPNPLNFDLLGLWSVVSDHTGPSDRNAWAFGHAIVEYWTQSLTLQQFQERFERYLQ
jgi:uncharacterized protein